jgi:Family of unknown function (DUF6448)
VSFVLLFVPKEGKQEVVEAFEQVMPVRRLSPTAREVADRLFLETVVRVHREGGGRVVRGDQLR